MYLFLILFILGPKIFKFTINLIKKNKFIILVVPGCIGSRGPFIFNKGLTNILPYNTNSCRFISSNGNFYINSMIDYFYYSCPPFNEKKYNKLVKTNKAKKFIFGPNFVPEKWFSFPDKNIWKEKRFPEIMKTIKGMAIHTDRAKIHLANRSNTTNMIKKYINMRQCSNIKPKNIKNFKERTIDILFFEKYIDLDREQQGKLLLRLLNTTGKKIETIKYGYYNKTTMETLSNNSKFIIYFSFYDIGPIGLIEIQNHGVILFTHQKEFVIDKKSSFFVPELANKDDMKSAFKIIMEKIDLISRSNPNSELIAKTNQNYYKCQKALEDLCKKLI